MVFSLHQDYLITQSKLFRQLLSSTPAHLDMPLPESTNSPQGDGTVKGAKMMPMVQGEIPSVCVPLPDPESFGLIVHWLYWYVISLPPPFPPVRHLRQNSAGGQMKSVG